MKFGDRVRTKTGHWTTFLGITTSTSWKKERVVLKPDHGTDTNVLVHFSPELVEVTKENAVSELARQAETLLAEMGPCDHAVGVCHCGLRDAVVAVKLLLGEYVLCSTCSGTGTVNDMGPCPTCRGLGRVGGRA